MTLYIYIFFWSTNSLPKQDPPSYSNGAPPEARGFSLFDPAPLRPRNEIFIRERCYADSSAAAIATTTAVGVLPGEREVVPRRLVTKRIIMADTCSRAIRPSTNYRSFASIRSSANILRVFTTSFSTSVSYDYHVRAD